MLTLAAHEKNPSVHITEKKNYLEYKEKEGKCKKRFIETVVVQEETYTQNGLNKQNVLAEVFCMYK